MLYIAAAGIVLQNTAGRIIRSFIVYRVSDSKFLYIRRNIPGVHCNTAVRAQGKNIRIFLCIIEMGRGGKQVMPNPYSEIIFRILVNVKGIGDTIFLGNINIVRGRIRHIRRSILVKGVV